MARERSTAVLVLCMVVILFFGSLKSGSSPIDPELVVSGRAELTASHGEATALSQPNDAVAANANDRPDGFMVLGMHRSGTSMLTGMLYMAAGYTFGGYLHKGGQNPKGFFERFDVVGQNEKWMTKQGMGWSGPVLHYDWEQGLKDHQSGTTDFKGGARFFKFIEDPTKSPWLQKDPRMCITLRTWRKILKKEPAIVFTYRHPFEVAQSLFRRGGNVHFTLGLQLWIAYNMRAIQGSRGMCIVRTKNAAIIADPLNEVQRVSDELTSKCRVPPAPHKVKQTVVDKFFDPNLQHHSAKEVLTTHSDGTCVVHDYESLSEAGTPAYEQERDMYLKAMKIYCDLESGRAYEDDYEWPDVDVEILPHRSIARHHIGPSSFRL